MTAQQLLLDLVNAGLNVRQYDGWQTRGGTWRRGKPVGVMHHHTAAPVPYPVARLAGSLLKANMNTKPNGEVWLIAYRACNFSSGSGSSTVLKEVLAGTPPTHNAKTRGLDDDTNGNPYFWNFENDHAGTGGPLPGVQERAITVATQVVNNHFGLTANNTISHAEWTYRKQDPYWNGDRRAIETIRQQVGDDMPSLDELRALIREEFQLADRTDYKGDTYRHSHVVGNSVARLELGSGTNKRYLTESLARTELASTGFEGDIDAAVDELIDTVPDEVLNRLYQRLAPGPS